MRSLAFLTSFYNINATLDIKKEYFDYLSKNLKKIYIVNTDKLNYLPKLARISYGEIKKEEKIYRKLPKNIHLINPKNEKEFIEFAQKKKIINC